jgi:hypothetical protein
MGATTRWAAGNRDVKVGAHAGPPERACYGRSNEHNERGLIGMTITTPKAIACAMTIDGNPLPSALYRLAAPTNPSVAITVDLRIF